MAGAIAVKKSLRVLKVVNVLTPNDLELTWEAAALFTGTWFGF